MKTEEQHIKDAISSTLLAYDKFIEKETVIKDNDGNIVDYWLCIKENSVPLAEYIKDELIKKGINVSFRNDFINYK